MNVSRKLGVITCGLLLLSIWLAVTIGHTKELWPWGPALIFLALAFFASIPQLWQSSKTKGNWILLCSGFSLVFYLAARASTSPVWEFALSDLLLLAAAFAAFFVAKISIFTNQRAERFFVFGLAGLLLLNSILIFIQTTNPGFSIVPSGEKSIRPAGLFGHYNYTCPFIIGGTLLLAGRFFLKEANLLEKSLIITVFVTSVIAIYFTQSRGGLVGIFAGIFIFCVLQILNRAKSSKSWILLLITVTPVALILVGAFGGYFLGQVQEIRSNGNESSTILDNAIRLKFLSLAASCIATHPLWGGGSRSFSWECYQHWDIETMGRVATRPVHVHNEFIQLLTDYGAVAGLLFAVFIVIITIHVLASTRAKNREMAIPWVIGGFAGLVGLLVQSNFEGIFRNAPNAIILGLCISAAALSSPVTRQLTKPKKLLSLAMTGIIVLIGGFIFIFGLKGVQVSQYAWKSHFQADQLTKEEQIQDYTEAIHRWPLGSLHEKRAFISHHLALETDSPEVARSALTDYYAAIKAHPFSPETKKNTAKLLQSLGKFTKATELFEEASKLQSEAEFIFRIDRDFGFHMNHLGHAQFTQYEIDLAEKSFAKSTLLYDRIASYTNDYFGSREFLENRVDSLVQLASISWRKGNNEKALELYDKARQLPSGNYANYYYAQSLGVTAADSASRSDKINALKLYGLAKDSMRILTTFPKGVPQSSRTDYLKLFEEKIQELQQR